MLRELTGEERSAYLRGIHPIWGGLLDEPRFLAFQRRLADAPEAHDRYRMLGWFEGDRLLSALKTYELQGASAGRPLRVLGIGAVYTPPSLRRKGYAFAMLRDALERAKQAGTHAALLFSDIDVTYYERLGFRPVESREVSVELSQLPRPAGGFRSAMAGDEPALARIFAAPRKDEQRLHLCRDEWTVRFQLRRLRELARARGVGEPEWGIVAETRTGEGGAMLRFGRDSVDVLDAAWSNDSARQALFGGLRDCMQRTGRIRLRLWPAAQLRGVFTATERRSSIAMVASLATGALLPERGGPTELALLDHN
ncbi:MAG TPA: GNAT family N-acetyltransferase [Myxococcales bacterium]|jgi:GNAT superfamily N-acetyltransferase|nr:GNAT family N-acetyltransferase [Myxococcales bacterium]